MKIAVCLYGEIYGVTQKSGIDYIKDFRDSWSNIKKMLIDPFKEQGHEVKIYISCYPIEDEIIRKEFYLSVNPDRITFNTRQNSDPYTCKRTIFENLKDDVDFIVSVRSDILFSRKLANENIDYTKFNFLFPEGRGPQWWNTFRFTNDMIYMWPHTLTPIIENSIKSCYRWPRKGHTDSHALWLKLIQYIPESEMHFISQFPEPSDVNSFYTINRNDVPLESLINDEVWVKHFKDKKYPIFNY
jgi:hypothetical protein